LSPFGRIKINEICALWVVFAADCCRKNSAKQRDSKREADQVREKAGQDQQQRGQDACRPQKNDGQAAFWPGIKLLERVGEAPSALGGGVSPVPMSPFLRALDIDAIIGPSWMPRVKVWLNPLDQTFAVAI
jgi:hypothetical protein